MWNVGAISDNIQICHSHTSGAAAKTKLIAFICVLSPTSSYLLIKSSINWCCFHSIWINTEKNKSFIPWWFSTFNLNSYKSKKSVNYKHLLIKIDPKSKCLLNFRGKILIPLVHPQNLSSRYTKMKMYAESIFASS